MLGAPLHRPTHRLDDDDVEVAPQCEETQGKVVLLCSAFDAMTSLVVKSAGPEGFFMSPCKVEAP